MPYPLDGKAFRLGRADDNRIIVRPSSSRRTSCASSDTGVGHGYRVP